MREHRNLSDFEFVQRFENCTLDPHLFSHEAHLRLAWIQIKKNGISLAIDNVRDQIMKYVKSLGEEDKYNETVTVAAVKAVNHFMIRSNSYDFTSFILENNRLVENFKNLLLTHYKTNIFESNIAKKKYLPPDLIPFE